MVIVIRTWEISERIRKKLLEKVTFNTTLKCWECQSRLTVVLWMSLMKRSELAEHAKLIHWQAWLQQRCGDQIL